MRVLVTGHTGFKGSWLVLWLAQQGHEVHGLALDPAENSLFVHARVSGVLTSDNRCDIRDREAVGEVVRRIDPQLIIHLAAQALVRESYREPVYTVETNVLGTLNILVACENAPSLKAAVIATTDKVYRNVGRLEGYVEHEPLGGDDIYSASKSMADLLTQSWASSLGGPPTLIVRAGNVIGGGDWSVDRLVPDLVRAFRDRSRPSLRNASSVRPWQHVLDCLHGYLTLAWSVADGSLDPIPGEAWNFGPDPEALASVEDVVAIASRAWGAPGDWTTVNDGGPAEAHILTLDSTKAAESLGWKNRLDLTAAVEWTMEWYQQVDEGADPLDITLRQIEVFERMSGHDALN